MEKQSSKKELEKFADEIRLNAIRSMHSSGGGHVGGALSMAELLSVLYKSIMNYDPKNPTEDNRDKLVLSKGHCGPGLYAALHLSGFFSKEELLSLNKNGTHLPSHCDMHKTPGVDMTTGSLGQGASTAAGMALGKKIKNLNSNVYLILGDGELNEGQVWEMAMFAKQHKIDNLIAFVDYNHQQLDGYSNLICDMGDIAAKFAAFGWNAKAIDGHDVLEIQNAVNDAIKNKNGSPSVIVLETIKGKGWSETEGKTGIHHIVISDEAMEKAEIEFAKKIDGCISEV